MSRVESQIGACKAARWTAATLLLLAGCGHAPRSSGPVTSPGELPPATDTPEMGLASLTRGSRDVQNDSPALRDSGPTMRRPRPPVEGPDVPIPASSPTPAEGTPLPAVSPAAPVTPPSPAILPMNDQIAAKAAELRALVELQGKAGKDPLHTTMALAALDAFIPPASDTARAQPPNQLGLSPGEARVASTFSDLFGKLDRQAKASSDAQKLAGFLTDAADSLSAMAAVRISYAGLCQRVESFGRFEPFPSMSFLAGRSHRAIVYVELDRFSARPAISADGSQAQGNAWVVEVSQELELIHDADGRQQWYRPPQTVVDSSRTRRRDFYLVNTIELPATLSVGAYSLKVTIRDKTGASTDERVIPLQVIADASATQSPRSVSLQK